MSSVLAILAAATEPCPDEHCPERRIGGFEDTRPICKTCAGSGSVPRMPGLREPCPSLHPPSCEYVGCPGYTIVPEDTALRVLLEWVLREGSSWELKGSRTGVSAYVQMQPSDRECCGYAYKSTLLEAFTAALMQALRLEVKRA